MNLHDLDLLSGRVVWPEDYFTPEILEEMYRNLDRPTVNLRHYFHPTYGANATYGTNAVRYDLPNRIEGVFLDPERR